MLIERVIVLIPMCLVLAPPSDLGGAVCVSYGSIKRCGLELDLDVILPDADLISGILAYVINRISCSVAPYPLGVNPI